MIVCVGDGRGRKIVLTIESCNCCLYFFIIYIFVITVFCNEKCYYCFFQYPYNDIYHYYLYSIFFS